MDDDDDIMMMMATTTMMTNDDDDDNDGDGDRFDDDDNDGRRTMGKDCYYDDDCDYDGDDYYDFQLTLYALQGLPGSTRRCSVKVPRGTLTAPPRTQNVVRFNPPT